MKKIAFVGCGFVADFYYAALASESGLELKGVYDKDLARLDKFSKYYKVPRYSSLEELLGDKSIDIVVNLTNPKSHFEVTAAALNAGKHVYCEKPFTMSFEDAESLYSLAKDKGLQIVSAPCNLFGETAQTIWKLLRDKEIGKVRLVYAEMDDGAVHLANPQTWVSTSGTPWPCKDEFEVGCTLEHAGYYVSWLVAFFGSAAEVVTYGDILVDDKGIKLDQAGPDFTVAVIKFKSGVIARLTCSIYAPHNHALQVIGDEGIISIDESWHNSDTVRLRKYTKIGFKAERYAFIRKSPVLRYLFGLRTKRVRFVKKPSKLRRLASHHLDFCRGISELAQAIEEKREACLSGLFTIHVNEIVLAIQNSYRKGGGYILKTACDEPAPLHFK